MPSNWDGVLILLAVTAITLGAEAIRRILPPPRYRDNIPVPWPVPDLTLPHPEDPNTTPKTISSDPKKDQRGEEEVSI
jgi:hypothetical protein